LADLQFPADRVQIHRTRLAYIHLDNLLHFAKIDRDGRVDGYIVAYLPDELALLFLRGGEPYTAVGFTQKGREVLPLSRVLKSMRDELERGELAFCESPLEQLVWMYYSGAAPTEARPVDPADPKPLFLGLQQERYSGLLELIVGGRVSYLRFQDGRYAAGAFADKAADESVTAYVTRLFASQVGLARPVIAANVYTPGGALPQQASPAMVDGFREVFARIIEVAEREVPGEARGRAAKIRDMLIPIHRSLVVVSTPRGEEPERLLATPDEMTLGLADWTLQLLEQLEIMAPGVAPQVLREATHEHRYVLQRAGFYGRLPWSVSW
jgi:hypothetical protein